MERKHVPVLSRRGFLLGGLGTAAAGWVLSAAPDSSRAEPVSRDRPNVLLLLSDQEREKVPRRLLRLRNRARLEEHGIRFTRAFCTTPQCSASRATILTGLYPHEAGVVANVDRNSMGRPLDPSIPNLGSVFRRHGYATGYLGKWHLGNVQNGLDAFGFADYKAGRGLELAKAAADWIAGQSARPWLLAVSFINPHDIYGYSRRVRAEIRPGVNVPPNFSDDLRGKPSPQKQFLLKDQGKISLDWDENDWIRYRSHYLDLIERVDSHIGLILDALEAKGELEKTVVVYSSDHGDMGGAHRLPFKGPFMYDELLNVPLVVSSGEMFSGPVLSDSLVSLVDLVPTVCSLSGVEWPGPLSGTDLSPVFQNHARPVRQAIFSEYYGKQKWVNPIRTVRTGAWKYNLYLKGGEELYHLENDPGELHNLAVEPECADVRRRLARDLDRWRRSTGDPLL